MEYTVNCHLPQWAESDRILMEDFNEAMANIDEHAGKAYTDDRPEVEYRTVSVPASHKVGDAALTLGYAPPFVLLASSDTFLMVKNGATAKLLFDDYRPDLNYMTLRLTGNQLVIQQEGENTAGNSATFSAALFR